MFLDARKDEADWRAIYTLAITFVVPRPIAFVSTVSAEGVRNLAPFSFYNMVSANPPVVMFCPSLRRDGTAKDSLRNVEATGEFVVATVTEEIADKMQQCSHEYPPEVSEFEACGFTPIAASIVRPALVAESPVNLECTLMEIKRFGADPGAGCAVFGRIVGLHVNDGVLADDGLVDPAALQAIGRMGRSTYSTTSARFDLPRPNSVQSNRERGPGTGGRTGQA